MLEQNQYYFHELDVRNCFKEDLEDIFLTDEVYDELGTEVYILTDNDQKSTFPCIYVNIQNPVTAERYSSTTEIQRYTDFTINFDIYSKDLEKYKKDKAVIRISEILINGIQKKYHSLILSLNQSLPNIDVTLSRRQTRFSGTLDNSSNFIYSN